MQNLLVKVDLIGIGLLLHTTARASRASRSGTILLSVGSAVHRCRHANLLRLEGRLVRLQHNLRVLLLIRGVDHEVVVVASRHHVLRVTRKDDFEFIKDAVVLVCVAETRPQVFVDRDSLDGLSFHVDIPHLDGQVVSGDDIPAIVGEANVGNGGNDFGEERTRRGIFLLFENYQE